MANILPAEYFGLPALGQLGATVGQVATDIKDRKRKEAKEDLMATVQEVAMLQSLFPNNPEVWIAKATEAGIVPPGTTRTQTLSERLTAEGRDPQTGKSYEQVTEGADIATKQGRQAVRLGEQQINANEFAAREMKFAEDARNAREKWLAEHGYGGQGVFEGMKLDQDFQAGKLQMDSTRLGMEATRLGMAMTRAQISRINAEMEQLRAQKDPNADWYEMVSKATFLPPTLIQAAMDEKSNLDPATRAQIRGSIDERVSAARIELTQKLQNVKSTEAMRGLENILKLKTAGLEVPDDLIWNEVGRAFTAAGMPGQAAWLLEGTELALPSGMSATAVAENVVKAGGGGTAAAPMSNEEGQKWANRMLQSFEGDTTKAMNQLEKVKGQLSAEQYTAIKTALSPQTSTATNVPKGKAQAPAPKPVETKKKRPGTDPYGSVPRLGHSTEYDIDQRKLAALNIRLRKADTEVQTAAKAVTSSSREEFRRIRQRVLAEKERARDKIKEDISDLERSIQEKIKKAGT